MTTVTRGGTASGWPLLPALLTVDLDFRWQSHQASDRGESPFLGYLQGRRVLCAGHIRVFSLRVRQGSVHLVDAGSERHHEREVHSRPLALVLPPEGSASAGCPFSSSRSRPRISAPPTILRMFGLLPEEAPSSLVGVSSSSSCSIS